MTVKRSQSPSGGCRSEESHSTHARFSQPRLRLINLLQIATLPGLVAVLPSYAWAAEGASEGYGSWLTLMFFALNFAAFVFIIVYFAGPAVRKFFGERSRGIRETLRRNESDFERAQSLANQAASRMAQLDAELERAAAEMDAQTEREMKRIAELAERTVERIRRDSELTAAAAADAGRRRVRARLAEMATRIAAESITANFDHNDQSRLIDDFVDRVRSEARA